MRFTEDALVLMEAYDWPGNVRELENTIQRACALCNSDVLLPSDIPLGSTGNRHANPASTVTRMRDALTTLMHMAASSTDIELLPWVEKELTRLAMRHFQEDVAKVAKFLGVDAAVIAKPTSQPLAAASAEIPAGADLEGAVRPVAKKAKRTA